jgi:HAD superfamily phosphoserine phosphatase-like hydrolase
MKSNSTQNQVVAFDLEGTITSGRISDGMTKYLAKYQNLNPKSIEGYSLLQILFLFKGFSAERFKHMAEWTVANELLPNIRKLVNNELQEHKKHGRQIIIVSAMFEPILSVFASQLNILDFFGTPLVFDGDVFTGNIQSFMNSGIHKVEKLAPFMTDGRIYAAYGDTVADISMLEMCENPTAINPDVELLSKAKENNWRILIDK